MMRDEGRFYPLAFSGGKLLLKAEVVWVFIRDAVKITSHPDWQKIHTPDSLDTWHAPARTSARGRQLSETVKVYSVYGVDILNGGVRFPLLGLFPGVVEDFVEIRIARAENVHAVCAPRPLDPEYREYTGMTESEFGEAGRKLWGFGLPHPFKGEVFQPHKRVAGPIVDHRPGTVPGWEFKHVVVRVVDEKKHSVCFRVSTSWDETGLNLCAELVRDEEVPHELQAYDFDKRPKNVWRPPVKTSAQIQAQEAARDEALAGFVSYRRK